MNTMMNNKIVVYTLFFLLLGSLSACGQKGPLELENPALIQQGVQDDEVQDEMQEDI